LCGDLWTISTGESEPVSMATSYSRGQSEGVQEIAKLREANSSKIWPHQKVKFQHNVQELAEIRKIAQWLDLSHAIDQSVWAIAQLEQANV
jgi:hypothetical protein